MFHRCRSVQLRSESLFDLRAAERHIGDAIKGLGRDVSVREEIWWGVVRL